MGSQVIGKIDVSAVSGNATVNITQGWARFYNHSIFGLTITLSDGQQFYVPPQKRRTICVAQPVGNFSWMRPLTINLSLATQLSQFMVIETLDPSDVHIENDLHDLGGSGNVGNSLPITVAQRLQDDSDPTTTEFIEASVSGTKHVSGLVDGYLLMIRATAGGNQPTYALQDTTTGKLYQLFLMTDGSIMWQESGNGTFGLRLFPDGHFTSDAGAAGTDGTGGFFAGIYKALANASVIDKVVFDATDQEASGKEWRLVLQKLATGGAFYLLDATDNKVPWLALPDGSLQFASNTAQIDASGNATTKSLHTNGSVVLVNGQGGVFQGQTGSGVQAFSKFTGTTTGTYSHGLGITPTHVDPEQHAAGSSSFGWDSETSTQVHITNFNGAAFSAMAYNI